MFSRQDPLHFLVVKVTEITQRTDQECKEAGVHRQRGLPSREVLGGELLADLVTNWGSLWACDFWGGNGGNGGNSVKS